MQSGNPPDTQPARRRRGRPRARGSRRPTRARILRAAYDSLAGRGYARISMREIARKAKVNQSLLHYYFGSKENLMIGVLAYVNEQLLARQRAMYAEAGSFQDVWRRALAYFHKDVGSGYVRVLWELWAQGLSNPRLRQQWVAITQPWLDLVNGLVRRGLAEQGIADAVPPEALRAIVINLYWGAEIEILTEREDPQVHFQAIALMGNLPRWLALERQAGAAMTR